jgi:NADH-quinone oxidoreductase subunit N
VSVLTGLARQRPVLGFCLVVLGASIAGIPPTAGFFGKFYLFQGAWEARDAVVLCALALTSLFNLFLFFQLMIRLYGHRDKELPREVHARLYQSPVLALALWVILSGIFHQEFLQSSIEPSLPKAFLNLPVPNVPFLGPEVE